jgi:hypothetical protein
MGLARLFFAGLAAFPEFEQDGKILYGRLDGLV